MARPRSRRDDDDDDDDWDDEPRRRGRSRSDDDTDDDTEDEPPGKTWRIVGVLVGMVLGLGSGFAELARLNNDDPAYAAGYLTGGILFGAVAGWFIGRAVDQSTAKERRRRRR